MFQTSVFRKTTLTGLLTNFGIFIPFAYKLALILTLVHKIFYICSSWGIFHKNMVELENILKITESFRKLKLKRKKNQIQTTINFRI